MHVVSPEIYRPKPKRRSIRPFFVWPMVVIMLIGAVNFLRPLPKPTASVGLHTPGVSTPTLTWLSGSEQAVAASGFGQLATNGEQTPLATASAAKVILALCVLQKQPLKLGDTGPLYTMDDHDEGLYYNYAEQDGSLVPVEVGEQLSEYQMLEAVMIASANNIADSLAIKVFGSHKAYTTYASDFLIRKGLTQTHIGSDASGFDPSTVSTASELTQLGLLALRNPVLMKIAGETSTTLPLLGTFSNYNTTLGTNGINGLKTGNNDADLGVFVFTATARIGSEDISLAGTTMGASDLDTALRNGTELVASLQKGLEQVDLTKSGQAVGRMTTAWGQSSPIVTDTPLRLVRWKATPLTEKHTLRTDARSGEVGRMQVAAGHAKTTAKLKLAHKIPGPSFLWRLTRH